MQDNLAIYNKVRQVPPEAQKAIQGGRLKGMTDINPMWRIKTLTEQFGPVGQGWYYEILEKRIEEGGNGEKVAFVDINLYVKFEDEWSRPIVGTGGSSFVAKEKSGLYTSDECFKMALTDAISVACKALGMGADVYYANDKSKYDESGQPGKTETKKQGQRKSNTEQDKQSNGNDANFQSFWANVKNLGFSEDEVHKVAGVDSLKGCSQKQLNSLLIELNKLKMSQSVRA